VCLSSPPGEVRGDSAAFLDVARGEDHAGASFCDGRRGGLADAAGRAGDEDRAAGQVGGGERVGHSVNVDGNYIVVNDYIRVG
jgi:hypothetical protein